MTVSLRGITREHVLSAIAEMDRLGREAFLSKYGFGKAMRYRIAHNGELYDSKAIIGAAHGYQSPDTAPLTPADFTGGEETTVRKLRNLDFEVIEVGSTAPSSNAARLFVITAANPEARGHLDRSLRRGVELSYFADVEPEVLSELQRHADNGCVYAWGARPGASAESKWSRLRAGDIALVYSGGKFVLSGTLVAKARSDTAARSVWGENENGETWACMMFFDPVKEVSITVDQVRELLGYQATYVPQGFDIPGRDRQERILERYGTVEAAVAALSGASDKAKLWWVTQGKTYERGRDGGYLWAPKLDKAGRTHADWDSLTRARPGDRILNYANGRIRAISLVGEAAFDADRPAGELDQDWSNEGRRLNVQYREIDPPIQLADIPIEWRKEQGAPFDQQGGVQQRYFFELSESFAKKMASAFPQLGLDGPVTPPSTPLTPDAVRETAESPRYQLDLPESLYATVVAALEAGKHIILTGPPGTAKTTLAEAIAQTAESLGQSAGYLLTTATADWTTYETIGGLKPTNVGRLEFSPGHFLEAIDQRRWLVIDELNRSQFDRAFGQLFTVLSGQAVTLPYTRPGASSPLTLAPSGSAPATGDVLPIPDGWRIVATMNVFDKTLLFEMSYALMRRFAFIEVASPDKEVFERLIDRWAETPAGAELAGSLLPLRSIKDIGPAVYRDIARFADRRFAFGSPDPAEVRFQAFYSYLLPQFEGLSDTEGDELYGMLLRIVGGSDVWRTRIRNTLNQVLGLEIADPTGGGTDDQIDAAESDDAGP